MNPMKLYKIYDKKIEKLALVLLPYFLEHLPYDGIENIIAKAFDQAESFYANKE